MKYLKTILTSVIVLAGLAACSPDNPQLGAVDVQSSDLVMGKAFTVELDAKDPNTVYLKSLMTGYTPLWEHPQGRSQAETVTLKIPFAGSYIVKFGVETRGGVVYGDPYTFELTTNNLSYVDDPLWTSLSGGVGNSKVWLLDLTAEGVCKHFAGPLFFYGTADWYGNVNLGLDPLAGFLNSSGEADTWNWQADWSGNGSWLFSSTGAADYGTMTFDLKNGAHVVVDNLVSGVKQNGTYMLNTEDYTLKMTDAGILHDPGRDAIVTAWGSCRVFYLDDNFLQLGVMRDNDPSEGNCMLVYNFISKDWADAWVPADVKPAEPSLPDGWKDVVGKITQTSIEWKLSEENPLDWCNLDGSRMNGWNAPADYPSWLGTPDPSVYGAFSLTMDSANDSYVYVTPDGTTVSGTYTLDEEGIYTFDQTLPSFSVISWASFATTADNQLRIMSIETDKSGVVSGMWLGAKSAEKEEYMAYHLIANVGSGSEGGGEEEEPGYNAKIYFANSAWSPSGDGSVVSVSKDGTYTCEFDVTQQVTDANVFVLDIVGLRKDYPASGALVSAVRYDGVDQPFDAGKVTYGDIEGNGNLRIEIYNAFGSTVDSPAIDLSAVNFSKKVEVEFQLKLEACPAQIMAFNSDWTGVSGTNNAGILGKGTYKISSGNLTAAINSPIIFCLDIIGYPDATTAVAGIKYIKLNDTAITIKPENLSYGDLEKKGNLRWEFFSIYGATCNGVTTSPYDYSKAVVTGTDFVDCKSIEMMVTIN